jgi:hypothetical protein
LLLFDFFFVGLFAMLSLGFRFPCISFAILLLNRRRRCCWLPLGMPPCSLAQ